MAAPPETEYDALIPVVIDRLTRNQRIRRNLPQGGRLRIDRQLPFLCLYRRPPETSDTGTRELVTTEGAYLVATCASEHHDGLTRLLASISGTLREHFGVLLFLEIWTEPLQTERTSLPEAGPAFTIVTPSAEELPSTIDEIRQALESVSLQGVGASVELVERDHPGPPGLRPWFGGDFSCPAAPSTDPGPGEARQSAAETILGRCCYVGLAVRPVYRDSRGDRIYPVVLQQLRRQLSRALRRAIFAFTGMNRSDPSLHYDSLGPTALVKASRLVDQQLCEISETFDFLLQATPVNAREAWLEFEAGGCAEPPVLRYRPLPYQPELLKRQLFEIPVEHIEDPTIAGLCQQKQVELDRQISALRDLDTPNFLYASLQLYGRPEESLVQCATDILGVRGEIELTRQAASQQGACVGAEAIVRAAREEIDHYHARSAGFGARVELCNHIAAGLMVAGDRLYVSETCRLPQPRLESLMHHEVGTHLLTYFNGREQPFRQLYAGLAGYDALQEGLAMLAEYLTGGLTANRLRTIAARVIAVDSLIRGMDFMGTFSRLRDVFSLPPHLAFRTTLRAHRGGGLTKDWMYLCGLRDVLRYIRRGHDLEPLYVGKIALEHVPAMQELRRRGIVKAPGLLPRFWNGSAARSRLKICRDRDLLCPRSDRSARLTAAPVRTAPR